MGYGTPVTVIDIGETMKETGRLLRPILAAMECIADPVPKRAHPTCAVGIQLLPAGLVIAQLLRHLNGGVDMHRRWACAPSDAPETRAGSPPRRTPIPASQHPADRKAARRVQDRVGYSFRAWPKPCQTRSRGTAQSQLRLMIRLLPSNASISAWMWKASRVAVCTTRTTDLVLHSPRPISMLH